MASRIAGSWFLALFALLWASLVVGLAALGLNDRFIDSAKDGWAVFLLAPLAATVPAAILAWIVQSFPAPDEETRAGRFLGLVAFLFALPVVMLPLYAATARILAGSRFLAIALIAVAAILFAAGAFRLARFVAVRLCPGGRPRGAAWLLPLIALVGLPPAGAWLSARPIPWDGKPRTLMLCVDGATWKLIDEQTAEGRLPTFRSLEARGARFDLHSDPPLMSPIIWTSIASGLGPSEHGVNSFYASSASVTAPRLWDMAEAHGMTVGLLGWPITWPPRPVPGFMIPSLFARGPETYPEELSFITEVAMAEKGQRKRDLGRYSVYGVRMIQYGVKLSTLVEAGRVLTSRGDFLEKMSANRFLKLRMHSDIFVELWERYHPEFAAFYNNGVDVTSHYFWKYLEPAGFKDVTPEEAARYGHMIPDMYAAMDRALGKILHFAPDDLNIVLVSDHGLQGMTVEDSGTVRLIRTENFLRALGLEDSVDGVNLSSRVHLRAKRGRGFPSGLADFIEDVVIEGTGEPVFRTDIDETAGLRVNIRPGFDFVGESLLIPGRASCPAEDLLQETDAKISGEHNIHAVLVLIGDPIRPGVRGGDASIYDVAPTTLELMGLPIGENMRGRVLEPAFREGYLRDHPIRTESYEMIQGPTLEEEQGDDEILKEQLRSLGYLN